MAIKPDISFVVPLYEKRISVFIGEERFDSFIAYCQKELGTFCPPRRDFIKDGLGLAVSTIIYLVDGDAIGPAVHELYHAVATIAENAGLEGQEATAYLLGYAVEKYTEERRKQNIKGIEAS